jgi:hypothetical protein
MLCVIPTRLSITFALVLNPSLPASVHCMVVNAFKDTILFLKNILPAQYFEFIHPPSFCRFKVDHCFIEVNNTLLALIVEKYRNCRLEFHPGRERFSDFLWPP